MKLVSLLVLLAMAATLVTGQNPRFGFYARTCPRAESIIRATVQKHMGSDATVAPGLLRMIFHDCFVQGCDASILISGAGTEKTAGPNLNLRGYEVIDDAKTQLETLCPNTVSCADILALASRDAVALSNGPNWPVPTGRRDGRVSVASDANNLPGFRESVASQIQKFTDKGLNTLDLVALVGGHTIGTSACQFFSYRLYNFNNTGGPDPTINAAFLAQLQGLCPQNSGGTTRVALDDRSVGRFDPSYFANLRNGKGVLESDQKLFTDASTRGLVQRFSFGAGFNLQFARSMVKMTNIGVKTGTQGEIRRVCSAIN